MKPSTFIIHSADREASVCSLDNAYLRLEKKFDRARKNWMRLTTHEKRNDKWWKEMKRVIKRSHKITCLRDKRQPVRNPAKRKRALTILTFNA